MDALSAERRFPVRMRIASAFVTRWCQAQRVEIVDGLYRVREDEPTPRIGAGHHKNPLKEPGVRCARDGGSVDQVGVPQSGDRVQSTRCTGPSNETELISASGNFSNDDGRA
jgi:hypothetical protein